ncbi:tetraacyldisaccharide 4'-kinase [Oxalobacteraceae bacterium GrIS 2.11]
MTTDRFARVLMTAWMTRGWLAWLLWPLSVLFGLLLIVRQFFYRQGWLQKKKLAVPVIVVGNIFVGGTGKTPLTIWLLRQLQQAGYRPGVISRGYGSKNQPPQMVSERSLAIDVGDEPILIAQQSACPVVVGRNRVAAGETLLNNCPEVNVIISDDGLQHYGLARDLEIMLFDKRGVGNGWLLPAGPLREPAGRRSDITVANLNQGENIAPALPSDTVRMQLLGNTARQMMHPDQQQKLNALDSRLNIIAAAGIGNPERFFTMLRNQGVKFAELPLPDHFNYAINPFEHITADMILITEKDAVKCRQLKDLSGDPRIWVIPVEAVIDSGMFDTILKKLKQIRE